MKHAMTIEEMKQVAPAVFTEAPADNVSGKYLFMPSYDIITQFAKMGWYPVKAQQNRNMKKSNGRFYKSPYETHLVMMINDQYADEYMAPQIGFINNHKARKSFKMFYGYHMFACLNGLISGEIVGVDKLTHIIENFDVFKSLVDLVLGKINVQTKVIQMAKMTTLNNEERWEFAYDAVKLYSSNPDNVIIDDILIPRRASDDQNNLWSVMNVVQENILKGGHRLKATNGKQTYEVRSRGITRVETNLAFNTLLWGLMERYLK